MYNRFKFLILALIAQASFAHIPYPAQAISQQPRVLRWQSSFKSDGKIITSPGTMSETSIETTLVWARRGQYQLTLKNVPARFTENGRPSTWTFTRKDGACVITINGRSARCPNPSFWATMELIGSVDKAIEKSIDMGLISREESKHKQNVHQDTIDLVNSEETEDGKKKKPIDNNIYENKFEIVNTTHGGKPFAGLLLSKRSSTSVVFGQKFLNPIRMSFSHQGDQIDLEAYTPLEKIKGTREQHILAKSLTVTIDGDNVAKFVRNWKVDHPKAKITLPSTGGSSLSSMLTSSGQKLLQALFVTH